MVATVHGAQAPQGEPQATVGVQTQRHVPAGVQLALQLHRPAQRRGRAVRHLDPRQHPRGGHREVVIGHQLGCRRSVHTGQLLLGQLVRVEGRGPGLDVHNIRGFFRLEEFDDGGRGEDDGGLGDVDNHPDGGERGLEILWVWRPDGDGDHAHVQTAVEGGDEVNTRGINQGHVVTGVQTTCNVVIVSRV